MQITKLLQHFEKITPLSEQGKADLFQRVKIKKLRRKQYLLQERDICKHYNFVLKGCLRMYQLDEKGVEHALQFATENGWITDIGSLHEEKPSRLYIDALEPTEVLQISKQGLIFLYINHPKFDRYFRVLTENAFVKMQQRVCKTSAPTPRSATFPF